MAFVEPASRDVDVLRLHLQRATPVLQRPLLGAAKQRGAYAGAPSVRRHPNIPQDCMIGLLGVERVESDCRASADGSVGVGEQERPALAGKATRPLRRVVGGEGIVVFDI